MDLFFNYDDSQQEFGCLYSKLNDKIFNNYFLQMENTFSDEQDLNTWNEDSNQIMLLSPILLGRPSPRMKYIQEDFSVQSLPFQSDTIDEEQELNNPLDSVEKILKITKKIDKKTKKYRKQPKTTSNPILNAARDFFSQVKQSNPAQQIQQFQQIKQMIDSMEDFLGQVKQQLITQVHQKGSRV
ncbi:unnamed protein product (macronuclear) [Paramecium tetraurelia]|uniref:Chromosome undetermined scaffold_1, whole genome shotgun sequence n=1 Tax=Paramecium tetraurelia TaxID=5888 RepID=Q6BFK4_PARTE|nr:hypothetical protein [Paramecium tetraurelia strain d4-2]XP_001423085.1 uncharacterized protein GSPATT00000122001 [Paramecium tetraurelia]CAH03566.1 hypothetical protein PTMB.369 [Paramecium tetraurelia]CAK55687.1 unnamed protein product [Paramecium tetraurelia]|eukprot:XP_001423085.1 hypothetical protein (macronuclear) [Paramecium tetraurelia strain d4-2]